MPEKETPIVKVPSTKTFEINGESKKLMISFAAQQQIVNLYGSLQSIDLLLTDPNIQTQAVSIVYFGREHKNFKTLDDIFEAVENIDADCLNDILEWIQEYFLSFTLAQTQRMTAVLPSAKNLMEKIQKV